MVAVSLEAYPAFFKVRFPGIGPDLRHCEPPITTGGYAMMSLFRFMRRHS